MLQQSVYSTNPAIFKLFELWTNVGSPHISVIRLLHFYRLLVTENGLSISVRRSIPKGIPVNYLEQLIIPLKKQGLVQSIQGPKGGHILARPPESISFAEIIKSLETSAFLMECVERPQSWARYSVCPTRDIWRQIKQAMYRELENIFLGNKL